MSDIETIGMTEKRLVCGRAEELFAIGTPLQGVPVISCREIRDCIARLLVCRRAE